AVPAAPRRPAHASRIRAGFGFRDRVALAALAAQRGAELAVDLIGRAVREHVGDARDVPPDAVGVAPEGLVHDHLLEQAHALPAVLARVVASEQPRVLSYPRQR